MDLGHECLVRTTVLFRWGAARLGYHAWSNKHWDRVFQLRVYLAEALTTLDSLSNRVCTGACGIAAPVVSSSDPINTALSGRGIITISGLSFADTANFTPTSSVLLSSACSSTAWTSLTSVSCTPQAYKGGALCVGVTLSGVVGTRSARFSFDSMGSFFCD